MLVLHLLEMLYLRLVLHLNHLLLALESILLDLDVLLSILLSVRLNSFEDRIVLDFLKDLFIRLRSPQCLVLSCHILGNSVVGWLSQVSQCMVLGVGIGLCLDDGPLLQVVAVSLSQIWVTAVGLQGLLVRGVDVHVPFTARVVRGLAQILSDLDTKWCLEAHSCLIIACLSHNKLRLACVGVSQTILGVGLHLTISVVLRWLEVSARMTWLCDLEVIRLSCKPRLLLHNLHLLVRNLLSSLEVLHLSAHDPGSGHRR